MIRALEIYELTGRTMTEQMEEDSRREGGFDVSLYALAWPRELLYDRINRRVDRMMDEGLVGEVQALLDAGVPRDATAMQALGYKEIAQALWGECTMRRPLRRSRWAAVVMPSGRKPGFTETSAAYGCQRRGKNGRAACAGNTGY